MKVSTILLITIIVIAYIGCEKKYSLEESKLINETKSLIIEYKFSVTQQETYLKAMDDSTKYKSLKEYFYDKHQTEWFKCIEMKETINKNIGTLEMAGIKYDFGVIPDDLSIERWEYLKEEKLQKEK